MSHSSRYLNPAEAARLLGVSTKALRLYEQRGLLCPARTAAGWRAYGGEAMERAREIAALRQLGLSLAEVGRVLAGDAFTLDQALAAHQGAVEAQMASLTETLGLLRDLRVRLASGEQLRAGEVARAITDAPANPISFDLPWPWGGERFAISRLAAVTYIVGSLGSGKTRLARRLAEALPGAVFSGLDRSARLDDLTAALRQEAEQVLARLLDDGATRSDALQALAIVLAGSLAQITVIDLIEQGLDAATQDAVGDLLRRRQHGAPPIVVMTRSTSILDLSAIGHNAALLLCPANHSPPMLVMPHPGASGYEALQSCLASPDVRARTEGMAATMPAS